MCNKWINSWNINVFWGVFVPIPTKPVFLIVTTSLLLSKILWLSVFVLIFEVHNVSSTFKFNLTLIFPSKLILLLIFKFWLIVILSNTVADFVNNVLEIFKLLLNISDEIILVVFILVELIVFVLIFKLIILLLAYKSFPTKILSDKDYITCWINIFINT